jgi:hypothetical protein
METQEIIVKAAKNCGDVITEIVCRFGFSLT